MNYPARTLVRKSLVQLLIDEWYISNGYFITPKIVTDRVLSVEQITDFPCVNIFFSEENYSSSEDGKFSSGLIEKECLIGIDVWGEEQEDPQLWRDNVISDIEKLFGNHYRVPLYTDNLKHCVRDIRIQKNISFGDTVNQRKIGIGISAVIYYGQSSTDPTILG